MNVTKKSFDSTNLENPQSRSIFPKKRSSRVFSTERKTTILPDSTYSFKTRLGLLVKNNYFKSIEDLLNYDKIREPKIVDFFFQKRASHGKGTKRK